GLDAVLRGIFKTSDLRLGGVIKNPQVGFKFLSAFMRKLPTVHHPEFWVELKGFDQVLNSPLISQNGVLGQKEIDVCFRKSFNCHMAGAAMIEIFFMYMNHFKTLHQIP